MIEDYFPNLPKLEMFARRTRPGWGCWGAEAPEGSPATAMEPWIAPELEIVVAEKAPAPPPGPMKIIDTAMSFYTFTSKSEDAEAA